MISADHTRKPSSAWQHEAGDRDAELAAAARQDGSALALLYERYVHQVYRYCLRRLGSREAAEDATAQVFTKLLAALPRYREDGPSFRSYLFAIAHNVLVDAERAYRPQQVLTDAMVVTDPAPGPEDEALASERRRELQVVLAAVPPDQRRILELRLAGLSTTEIARTLGISLVSVRVRQCRAIKRLRIVMGMTPHGLEDRDG